MKRRNFFTALIAGAAALFVPKQRPSFRVIHYGAPESNLMNWNPMYSPKAQQEILIYAIKSNDGFYSSQLAERHIDNWGNV